jgi:hypothetical protein
MKTISLLYHDVVQAGQSASSGYGHRSAERYKLEWPDFERHLEALEAATERPPERVRDLLSQQVTHRAWMLTFDDGGASSIAVGEALARVGWSGHFFVASEAIGLPGFLGAEDIRVLRDMGHLVGSHSRSHPEAISTLPAKEILLEWTQSFERLSDILGERVTLASVPGGFYTSRVGRAAAAAGAKALFTSEPQTRTHWLDGCLVIGRFTITRGTPTDRVAGIVAGKTMPRLNQFLSWQGKKAAKRVGGRAYLRARTALLDRLPL